MPKARPYAEIECMHHDAALGKHSVKYVMASHPEITPHGVA
jgi:hypothetical protein